MEEVFGGTVKVKVAGIVMNKLFGATIWGKFGNKAALQLALLRSTIRGVAKSGGSVSWV